MGNNKRSQSIYIIHNDIYDGIKAGTISLTVQEDGSILGFFDRYIEDRREAIEEKKFQDAKYGIYIEGVGDIITGTVGIITASVEEIGTGGLATTLVITQLTLSVDELTGGINKLNNPRAEFEGKESKPIEFLVGEFIGENGNRIYDVIDVSLGVNEIPKSDKLINIIGVYDTLNDAAEASADEAERQKNK